MDCFNDCLADVDCHTVVVGVHGVLVGLQRPTLEVGTRLGLRTLEVGTRLGTLEVGTRLDLRTPG